MMISKEEEITLRKRKQRHDELTCKSFEDRTTVDLTEEEGNYEKKSSLIS